jgi:hypothetical protein
MAAVMALTVAGISLAVGCFTVAKLCLPAVDAWAQGREILVGGAVRYLRNSGEMSFGRNRIRSGQMIVRESTPSIGSSMIITSFST